MKIKNKDLYEQLKKTTFAALDYIKRYPIHVQPFPPIHELSGLEDFTKCIVILSSDSMINRMFGKLVGIDRQLGLLLPEWVVKIFVLKFYEQSHSFRDEVFNKLYLDLEEFLYTEKIRVVEKNRLYNFDFEGEEINFSKDLSIVKKEKFVESEEEIKEDFLSISLKQIESEFILRRQYYSTKIIADKDYEHKGPYPEDTRMLFDLIINSLRIFKKSKVYRNTRIETSINVFSQGFGYSIGFTSNVFNPGIQCKLDVSDQEELLKIFKELKTRSDKDSLIIASKRLDFGMARGTTVDKIIDFIIGLESLYLPQEKQELTYRIAIRIAYSLEQSNEKRKELFEFIKKYYKIRSKIVHGEEYEILNIEEIDRLEEILRLSIKNYIDDGKRFKKDYLENITF